MNSLFLGKKIILFHTFILICCTSFANVDLLTQARNLQREGKYDKAINAFKNILQQKKESKENFHFDKVDYIAAKPDTLG